MSARIGINGFGRMGRLALRAGWGRTGLSFVHINEVAGGAATAAHLLTFDSVHGRWPHLVEATDTAVVIDNTSVPFSSESTPGAVDWASHGVDMVLECSGRFRTVESLEPYFAAGVKKVIVAAPVKTGALNVVMGVNDHLYDPSTHHLVTAASCTTNCLAPVVKVVHETIGIRHGVITTIHDVTNTQSVVDAPHKDLRRARAAPSNIIPTTTGAARSVGKVLPRLKGKLDGLALRVPVPTGSLVDFVVRLRERPSALEVNAALRAAAEGTLSSILQYCEAPLVSSDIVGNPRSAILDPLSTEAQGDGFARVVAWYDNEWGYSNRVVDLIRRMAGS